MRGLRLRRVLGAAPSRLLRARSSTSRRRGSPGGLMATTCSPVVFGHDSRDLAAPKLQTLASTFMPLDCVTMPPPVNALERAFADLWVRTAGPMPQTTRRIVPPRRRGHDRELAVGAVQPDARTASRTRSTTWRCAGDLRLRPHHEPAPRGHGRASLPPEVYRAAPALAGERGRRLRVLPERRLLVPEGDRVRGRAAQRVLVVQNFLDFDTRPASAVVNDLMTSRMQQFEHVARPRAADARRRPRARDEARESLDAYVEGLQDWMAGILDWHIITRRYDEAFLRRHNLSPSMLLGGSRGSAPRARVSTSQAAPGPPSRCPPRALRWSRASGARHVRGPPRVSPRREDQRTAP